MKYGRNLVLGQSLLILFLISLVYFLYAKGQKLEQLCESGKPEQIQPGDKLPIIQILDSQNNSIPLVIDASKKGGVLFIFDVKCVYCTKNISVWQAVYHKYSPDYTIAALSNSEKNKIFEYQSEHAFSYPAYHVSDSLFRKKTKLNAVPQTLITDSQGIVKKVWVGQLNPENIQELMDYLK